MYNCIFRPTHHWSSDESRVQNKGICLISMTAIKKTCKLEIRHND